MPTEQLTVLKHSVLTGVVRKFPAPQSLLGAKIFTTGAREKIWGESVLVDIVRNPRHRASYNHPDAEGKLQPLNAVEQKRFTLPYIREKKRIPKRMMKQLREPGTEHQPYKEALVASEMRGLDIVVANLQEWCRWQILMTGAAAWDGDDVKWSVDFTMSATHKPTLTGTDKWSDTANSDPASDINTWKRILAQDSGTEARDLIVTNTVMQYLVNNAKVRAVLSDAQKDLLVAENRIARLCGLNVVEYNQGYVPVGGSFTNYLDTDKVVLWNGLTFPEYEGIAPDDEATTPGKVGISWGTKDPPVQWLLEALYHLPSAERVEELFCADVA
jgi:hypothetical protein